MDKIDLSPGTKGFYYELAVGPVGPDDAIEAVWGNVVSTHARYSDARAKAEEYRTGAAGAELRRACAEDGSPDTGFAAVVTMWDDDGHRVATPFEVLYDPATVSYRAADLMPEMDVPATLRTLGLDPDDYRLPEQQAAQVSLGLEAGIDTDLYDHPELHQYQMREIRLALEAGLDPSSWALGGFDWRQMHQIRAAQADKIELEHLLNPRLDWRQMREVRLALAGGLDVSDWAHNGFDWRQMHEIRFGAEEGLAYWKYAEPAWAPEQMREIRIGLWAGVDLTEFATPAFIAPRLAGLRKNLTDGKEVFFPTIEEYVYARVEPRAGELWENYDMATAALECAVYNGSGWLDCATDDDIDDALDRHEANLIFEGYDYLGLDDEQLFEIRSAIWHGIDPAPFSDPAIDAEQMCEARMMLEEGLPAYEASRAALPTRDRHHEPAAPTRHERHR